MPLITIRGPLGSGSPEIGKIAAELLHIDYVDREIIAAVAARLDRREDDVKEEEMPSASLFGRIARALERGYSSEIGFDGRLHARLANSPGRWPLFENPGGGHPGFGAKPVTGQLG